MPTLKSRGNGLFIEVTRTPQEKKQAEKFQRVDALEKENKDLKDRIKQIEEMMGLNKKEDK